MKYVIIKEQHIFIWFPACWQAGLAENKVKLYLSARCQI